MNRSWGLAAAALLLGVLVGCGGGAGGGGQGNDVSGSTGSDPVVATPRGIQVGSLNRTYNLYVPATFQPNVSGLVIALHGSGENGAYLENLSHLSEKAQQAGFAVAYPDGIGKDWNYYFLPAGGTDDVAFMRALITQMLATIHPDPRRIYVSGFSNGGRMAYRTAIDLSDMIAAVGVVEGTLYSFKTTTTQLPSISSPVSAVVLQGDQDILYCGGTGAPSQDDVFAYWSGPQGNNCKSFDTPNLFCASPITYERDAINCTGNAEVKSYILTGGIHTWYTVPLNDPTKAPYSPSVNQTTGVTTNDILWNFFTAHPKP